MSATHRVWGADQAALMLRFAIHSRLVVVREPSHLSSSCTKARSV